MLDGLWGDFVERAGPGGGVFPLHTVGLGSSGARTEGKSWSVGLVAWPRELEGVGREGERLGEKVRELERAVRPHASHGLCFGFLVALKCVTNTEGGPTRLPGCGFAHVG